jgi:succinate dehydrogenase / fumarate reductase cytochrome b subunit
MRGAYLRSSIGKKQMMAITGLAWCGFVTAHMLGNLLFLVGPEAFNAYGHALTSNKPLIYTAEAGLVLTLALHVIFAVLVVMDNARARPIGYAVSQQRGAKTAASLASRTMKYSGAVILVFVVLHLFTFKFGPYYPTAGANGGEIRDLAKLMEEVFSGAGYFVGYIAAMVLLAFHLTHALWSSLQTMNWIPGDKEPSVRKASYAFGLVIAAGFAVNPIYIFFTRG